MPHTLNQPAAVIERRRRHVRVGVRLAGVPLLILAGTTLHFAHSGGTSKAAQSGEVKNVAEVLLGTFGL